MKKELIALCIFFALVISGCVLDQAGSTISDGELVGIEDLDVHGMIDCEPNEGHMGTPVTITITFDRNAILVQEIRTWQAYERSSWEFERTPDIDPQNEDGNRWAVWRNLFLSGESGIVRFYAINSDERIGFGDIEINGGKPD
jgi:hypothetical protein